MVVALWDKEKERKKERKKVIKFPCKLDEKTCTTAIMHTFHQTFACTKQQETMLKKKKKKISETYFGKKKLFIYFNIKRQLGWGTALPCSPPPTSLQKWSGKGKKEKGKPNAQNTNIYKDGLIKQKCTPSLVLSLEHIYNKCIQQ